MTLDPYGWGSAFYTSPKVKFVVEEQLVKVVAEEDIVATLTTFSFYIDADENATECSFHSLEVVNTTFVGMGMKIPKPQLSKVTKTGVKQIVGSIWLW